MKSDLISIGIGGEKTGTIRGLWIGILVSMVMWASILTIVAWLV